jgi:hypothetical protein
LFEKSFFGFIEVFYKNMYTGDYVRKHCGIFIYGYLRIIDLRIDYRKIGYKNWL